MTVMTNVEHGARGAILRIGDLSGDLEEEVTFGVVRFDHAHRP
jgi:hypothetical protein